MIILNFCQFIIILMESKSIGINFNLIFKVSAEKDLKKIKKLDFYSKSNKIKKIENLEDCVQLEELNLSYNYISKIENLSTLINLKTLDLSENSIKKIENLNNLGSLEHLNLSGNLIKEIDKENIVGLTSLSFLNLSKNKIARMTEFGNLKVLKNLENLCAAGNLIKKNDLQEFISTKIHTLKFLDGNPVCYNPPENPSIWVLKENLKEYKQDLLEKSKVLKSLKKQSGNTINQIKSLQKAGPDKEYMKELLNKADALNATSLSLQQTMTENRDILKGYTKTLESLKTSEKRTKTPEEVKLISDIKSIKEYIEELEAQYGIVLEELELVAGEITKIDDIINNTPKFKSNELNELEILNANINKSIENTRNEIEDIKDKIEECYRLMGTKDDAREFFKVMDDIWKKLTDEVWVEESDDLVKDLKVWGARICEIIDKERSELALANANVIEENKKLQQELLNVSNSLKIETETRIKKEKEALSQKLQLETQIKTLEQIPQTSNLHDNQAQNIEYESLETLVSERLSELKQIEQIIHQKSLVLLKLEQSNEKISTEPQKHKNPEVYITDNDTADKFINKLSQIFNIPKDINLISQKIEDFYVSFGEFDEKCLKLKRKKKELIESFQAKNLEIQQKIKNINNDRAEINKEKAEVEKYKTGLDSLKKEKTRLKTQIKQSELVVAALSKEKNDLENEKIKLSCHIDALKETYQLYEDKNYRLISEYQKIKNLNNTESQKVLSFQNEIKQNKKNLKNYKTTEKKSDLSAKNKLMEYEFNDIDEQTHKGQQYLAKLICEIDKKKNQLSEIKRETDFVEEKYKKLSTELKSGEDHAYEIDSINKHLINSVKTKQNQLQVLENEIKDKMYQLERIQMHYRSTGSDITRKQSQNSGNFPY